MSRQDFYTLGSDLVSDTFQAKALGLDVDAIPHHLSSENPHYLLIKGEPGIIPQPIVFQHTYGTKLKDFLDTGWPSLFLASDRLLALLERAALTGWARYPIRLLDKNNTAIKGYYGFSITGRCGPITTQSAVRPATGKRIFDAPRKGISQGAFFDTATWQGTDFSLPDNAYTIIVTQQVADLFCQEKVTNARFTNILDKQYFNPHL